MSDLRHRALRGILYARTGIDEMVLLPASAPWMRPFPNAITALQINAYRDHVGHSVGGGVDHGHGISSPLAMDPVGDRLSVIDYIEDGSLSSSPVVTRRSVIGVEHIRVLPAWGVT